MTQRLCVAAAATVGSPARLVQAQGNRPAYSRSYILCRLHSLPSDARHMSQAAILAASRRATQHVKPTAERALRPQQLLSLKYEAFPQPINCTTLGTTQEFASDDSHPFHVRTLRKLDAFDATKLHWRVRTSVDVSSKGFIRSWAVKRVKRAFAKHLNDQGWAQDGSPLLPKQQSTVEAGPEDKKLGGALLITLNKSDHALTASDEEVRESAGSVLSMVLRLRREALRKQQRVGPARPRREAPNEQHRTLRPAHKAALELNARASNEAFKRKMEPDVTKTDIATDTNAIRTQIEFYFSDANLPFDAFLLNLTGGSANRPVSLRTIYGFKRMRRFNSYAAVKHALSTSQVLKVVDMDGVRGVMRRVPLHKSFADNFSRDREIVEQLDGMGEPRRQQRGATASW